MKKIVKIFVCVFAMGTLSFSAFASNYNPYQKHIQTAALKVVESRRTQRVLIQANDYNKYYKHPKEVVWDVDEALIYAFLADGAGTFNDISLKMEVNRNGSMFVTLTPEIGIMANISKQKDIKKRVTTIIKDNEVKSLTTDIEKIKWVYDYVKNNCEYASLIKYKDNSIFNNAWSALFEGPTLCYGYTLLAEAFFNELNIDNIILGGKVFEEGQARAYVEDHGYLYGLHAWNLVKANNKWYHFDVTFGDRGGNVGDYEYLLKGSNSFKNIRDWRSLESLPEIEDEDFIL